MIKTIPIVLRGYTVQSWMSVSLPCIKEINKLTWNDSFKSFNYRRAKLCYSCVRLYVTSTQIGHTASNRSVDIPQQITVNKEYHPNITLGSTCEPALETPTINAKSHLPPVSFMDLSIKPMKKRSKLNPWKIQRRVLKVQTPPVVHVHGVNETMHAMVRITVKWGQRPESHVDLQSITINSQYTDTPS